MRSLSPDAKHYLVNGKMDDTKTKPIGRDGLLFRPIKKKFTKILIWKKIWYF